jgi:hypothetical protein
MITEHPIPRLYQPGAGSFARKKGGGRKDSYNFCVNPIFAVLGKHPQFLPRKPAVLEERSAQDRLSLKA